MIYYDFKKFIDFSFPLIYHTGKFYASIMRKHTSKNIFRTIVSFSNKINFFNETLIGKPYGMKRKAHGAQEPRHIW